MSAPANLEGMRFGRLVASHISGSSAGRVVWRCSCDCGSVKDVQGSSLTRGFTKSCGCLRKEKARAPKAKSLVGEKFSRLTVLGSAGRKRSDALWLCLCECGEETTATTGALRSSHKQSCGCLNKERVSEAGRMDLTGLRSGRLVVLEAVGVKRGCVMWRCICDCGNSKDVMSSQLKSNLIISCGCANFDKPSLRPKPVRDQYAAAESLRRARMALAPGSFTPEEIDRLLVLQRGKCASCTVLLGLKFHRDHILALSRGGSNDITNIQLLCPLCNLRKHAKSPDVWAKERGMLL